MSQTTKRKFCASPWLEGVLRPDGNLLPCCQNISSYGNWLIDGVKNVWQGEIAKRFRQDIIAGRFPNTQCRACYLSSTNRTPGKLLWGDFHHRMEIVGAWIEDTVDVHAAANRYLERIAWQSALNEFWQALCSRANTVFHFKSDWDAETEEYFRLHKGMAEVVDTCINAAPSEVKGAWHKIGRTLTAVRSFLDNELEPTVVVPHRQPNIIAICNARCIHCPGRHTDEIVNGMLMPDGSRFKQMPIEQVEKALAYPEDILGFTPNGSEFLFYNQWRKVANLLKNANVKLQFLTNTICLTPAAIDYLIDNDMLAHINISIDGATKETVESTRVNVKFDRLQANVRYLFERLGAACNEGKIRNVGVTFSFVLMKRNHGELPELVRLIDRLCNVDGWKHRPKIIVQALLNLTGDRYTELFAQEHHSNIDPAELQQSFREMQKESNSRRIPVNVLEICDINEFIARGFPFPDNSVTRAAEPAALSTRFVSLKSRIYKKIKHIISLVRHRNPDKPADGLPFSGQLFPPGHFYSPVPSLEQVKAEENRLFAQPPRTLPGIDLREDRQVALLRTLHENYGDLPFPDKKTEGLRYFYENPNYSYGDAIILHLMIRHLRPKRIIEIGSGYSSCVALDTNELFFNNSIRCTYIEPYPELLHSLIAPGDRTRNCIIGRRVQDVEMELFDELAAGDILFIDSTHVAKIGSDVNHIFSQVLPRLHSGVYVHFHDIFYPFEYPKEWVYSGISWNENYLLRAFLQFNSAFQIEYFANFMFWFHRDLLAELLPLCLKNSGGNIWLKSV